MNHHKQPIEPPTQRPPPPHQPRTTLSHQVTNQSVPQPKYVDISIFKWLSSYLSLHRMFLAHTFGQTLWWCFGRVGINLNIFNHPSPSHLSIQNDLIPNKAFTLGFVPSFMVEHPKITLNPNRPKHDVVKKVPNFNFLNIALGFCSLKRVCF